MKNKGYAKFGSGVRGEVGGGGGANIVHYGRCANGEWNLSSLVALRHVLHPKYVGEDCVTSLKNVNVGS